MLEYRNPECARGPLVLLTPQDVLDELEDVVRHHGQLEEGMTRWCASVIGDGTNDNNRYVSFTSSDPIFVALFYPWDA